jgi:hypothetical protein
MNHQYFSYPFIFFILDLVLITNLHRIDTTTAFQNSFFASIRNPFEHCTGQFVPQPSSTTTLLTTTTNMNTADRPAQDVSLIVWENILKH